MLYKCLKRISHDRKFNVSRKITTENFIAVSPFLYLEQMVEILLNIFDIQSYLCVTNPQ